MEKQEVLIKLGDRIAALRQAKGLTQLELAYKCDIESTNVVRLEKGRTNPTVGTLLKVSQALEVSLAELFE